MNTTVTLKITGSQIVEALRRNGYDILADARIEFHVPGGGDWSNRDVGIDADNPLVVTFSRPTAPLLEVRKLPDTETVSPDGRKIRRHVLFLVNGVEMEVLHEEGPRTGWSKGANFTCCVNSAVARYEAALRTKAVHTEGRS